MSRNLSPRLRGLRLVWNFAAAVAVMIYIACSNNSNPYEPLGKDHPASGEIVAGAVRDPGHAAVKGAIVSIEALTNGVPATALALQEHPELAGKLDTRAAATSDATRRVTLTDDRGRFAFDGLAAGEYAIQVRASDHLGATASVAVPNTPMALDTIIVDVNLTPTGTFSGVATLENGTVHSDIVVYCQGTSYVAVTDPTGAYALTDVPVGSYTIQATKSHYLDDSKNGTLTFAGQNLGLPAMLLKIDNNIAPVATITIPAQTMQTGSPIQFQSAGSDLDGTVVNYEWDFENDGTMDASSASPGATFHTYATPGNYTVKLRVTDNLAAIGLDAKTITVAAPPPFTVVYMSTTGSDTNNGTQGSPVKTLVKAYQIAQANSITQIRAAAGAYIEVPAFLAGISVDGGYDGTLWTPNAGYTTFACGTSSATANAITTATTITRVEITTANQVSPGNSVALYSTGSTAALQFVNCRFIASAAGSGGPAGGNGSTGPAGLPGINGGPGSCDGTVGLNGGAGGASPSGCPGGTGGNGRQESTSIGTAGAPGACGGGAGGFLGGTGDPGGPGGNGTAGTIGSAGSSGTPASSSGSIAGGQWVPGTGGGGSTGASGNGGGGGGGGGDQFCAFCNDGGGNGGGGGGGGGGSGTAGSGGLGGYGSFAVMLIASSPTFQSCYMQSGSGGTGRNGGNGGNGGAGGAGAPGGASCTGEVGRGGDGGNGGQGGGGGGGAGGAGGPSVGILLGSGSTPTLTSITYVLGSAGPAGVGGNAGNAGPPAPAGSGGVVANTLTL